MKNHPTGKRRLVLTVGLPYSGKSTWARQQGHPIVSPDSVRLALHGKRFVDELETTVWGIVRTMVSALCLSGHESVIVDATNYSALRRLEWVEWAMKWVKGWGVPVDFAMVIFDTPYSVCSARAAAAGDAEIAPVIERMSTGWEDPRFDRVPWEIQWEKPEEAAHAH